MPNPKRKRTKVTADSPSPQAKRKTTEKAPAPSFRVSLSRRAKDRATPIPAPDTVPAVAKSQRRRAATVPTKNTPTPPRSFANRDYGQNEAKIQSQNNIKQQTMTQRAAIAHDTYLLKQSNNDTVSDFTSFRALLMGELKLPQVIKAYLSIVFVCMMSYNKNIKLFDLTARLFRKHDAKESLAFEEHLWRKSIQLPDP